MGKFKITIILISIIIIAGFLRFNQLSNVPPSASLDEASIGYNAYSILKTGGDEYGTKFPILLRAYDDFRPALYVYFVIPFIKIFGLNVFAVRFPSVILSVLTVFSTYFLVKKLFDFIKYKTLLALVSSFLLAISPWHIYISRLGHEVNAGLSFVVFSITFFIYAILDKNKRWMLILSSVFFALSFYTYQSEKIFVPLILIILFLIYRKNLFEIKREFSVSVILGVLLVIPIISATAAPQALIRLKGTSAFSPDNKLYQESAEKLLLYKKEGNVIGQFLANRRITTLKIFLTNYFSHYSFNFLFRNSDNESFRAPRVGLLYHWEFPFIVLGLIFLFLKTYDKKIKIIIISWIIISFIAPALTTETPHAMRSYNILPMPQVLVGLGIIELFDYLLKKRLKLLFYSTSLFVAVSIIYYLLFFYKQYFFNFPKAQSSSFQYALSKTIQFVLKEEKYYDKIVLSNKDNLYQSYMFFLFYSKYAPFSYQKQGGTVSGGFAETHQFGRYSFEPINKNKIERNVLYIGNVYDFYPNTKTVKVFKNLNGDEEIKIVYE